MTVVEMGAARRRAQFNGGDGINRGVGEIALAFVPVGRIHRRLRRRRSRSRCWRSAAARPSALWAAPGCRTALSAARGGDRRRNAVLDATEFVDHLKAMKIPEEIKLIRAAAEMQDEIFAKRPGLHQAGHARHRRHRATPIRRPAPRQRAGDFPWLVGALGQASLFRATGICRGAA